MTEETNTKNSKAVIVRRFTSFLMIYLYIFGCLFCGFPELVLSAINSNSIYGLSYHIAHPYAVIMSLIGFWLVFPVFLVSCFLQKAHFICEPSKINFFHFLTLIISFVACFIMCAVSLFIDVSEINTNLTTEYIVKLQWLFLILSSVSCMALSFKSTFRKRIFMKKG